MWGGCANGASRGQQVHPAMRFCHRNRSEAPRGACAQRAATQQANHLLTRSLTSSGSGSRTEIVQKSAILGERDNALRWLRRWRERTINSAAPSPVDPFEELIE